MSAEQFDRLSFSEPNRFCYIKEEGRCLRGNKEEGHEQTQDHIKNRQEDRRPYAQRSHRAVVATPLGKCPVTLLWLSNRKEESTHAP